MADVWKRTHKQGNASVPKCSLSVYCFSNNYPQQTGFGINIDQ